MKSLLLVISILSQAVASAQEVTIALVPIAAVEHAVKISFDGASLSKEGRDGEPEVKRLSEAEARNIRRAILSAPVEHWGGHWGSMDSLDGYELAARIEVKGKVYAFSGSNGCPPGFAEIAKSIGVIDGYRVLASDWGPMERSAKRFGSREEFFRSALKAAREKGSNDPTKSEP